MFWNVREVRCRSAATSRLVAASKPFGSAASTVTGAVSASGSGALAAPTGDEVPLSCGNSPGAAVCPGRPPAASAEVSPAVAVDGRPSAEPQRCSGALTDAARGAVKVCADATPSVPARTAMTKATATTSGRAGRTVDPPTQMTKSEGDLKIF